MLNKQKKLSDILSDIQIDIKKYLHAQSKKNHIDIDLIIQLCNKLGSFSPYPLLQYDKNDNNLLTAFNAHETYLIQLYLLFSEENNEVTILIEYLFLQIQLGFHYEKNSVLLNEFFNKHYFSQEFLNKHDIKGHLNISQLLLEPIQYFPRFILLLSTLIDKLKPFQLNNEFNLPKMLWHIYEKVANIGKSFDRFLECRYPDEIHLFFLEKVIMENLTPNKNISVVNQKLSELCIQQTLRTDRLRILDKYMKLFLEYLKAYEDHRQKYFMYLFTNNNTEALKLIKEWNNSSPEYVKIFNDNQHENLQPSLIFQEGLLKLYQTSIQLLIARNTPNEDSFSRYSLNSFIMAYIQELEETMLRMINNPDYVPKLSAMNIEEQLDKLGAHTKNRKDIYYYYQSLYTGYWEKTTPKIDLLQKNYGAVV
jgi:hypothetical protein